MSAQLAPGGQLLLDPQMYPDGHRMPANPPQDLPLAEFDFGMHCVEPADLVVLPNGHRLHWVPPVNGAK